MNDWVEIAPILGIFAFGGVPDHGIGIFWYCYFMSLLMFSFVLVCLFVCFLVFFVGKKACPSMALLGVGNS